MTGPGPAALRKHSLVAVLSATPERTKAGELVAGQPAGASCARPVEEVDEHRTFDPPRRVVLARGVVELVRLVPVVISAGLAVGVLLVLQAVVARVGWLGAAALGGVVLMVAGAVAAGTTTVAKWVLVGPTRAGEHPLWSSFVWRNEVVDTFVELLVVPWFAGAATGTPALSLWLRTLGARIGRGVWCETYWLPEADLVRLGDGVTRQPRLCAADPPVP